MVPVPTTSASARRVALAPGDPLVLEERLAENPLQRPVGEEKVTLDAWFVDVVPPPGAHQVSAFLGQATVFRDGRVRLASSVPSVVAERWMRFSPATARPTSTGTYRIEGIPGVLMLVDVTQNAPALDLPADRPAPVPRQLQVLGDNDLAGVAFGTRDDVAENLLVARFGEPTDGQDWQNGCGPQFRYLSWGGLRVDFRRDAPGADGHFALYTYSIDEWSLPGTESAPVSVRGLGTRDGVVLGSTVAHLRGADPKGEFSTGYDGFRADLWNVPGRELVALLDGDFLYADARVGRIAAPRETGFMVC